MKIYFEECGFGRGKIILKVYVTPTGDGCGYFYSVSGKKVKFAWANPKEARVFDSSELPEDLWFSIQHGVHHVEVEDSKEDSWTFDDLEYIKVSREQVEAKLIVDNKINDVKTLEDFKNLYPTIKKSDVVSKQVMDKLFSLLDVPEIPVHNGEIGIALIIQKSIYDELLVKAGIE